MRAGALGARQRNESAAATMGLYASGGYTEGSLLATFDVTAIHRVVGNVSSGVGPGWF